jgi:hypothetical protein
MGFLLQAWNIPYQIFEPLTYVSHGYNSVLRLGDPLCLKVEILKVAILIAEIAIGKWNSWDRIDLPPEPVLNHLGIDSYTEIIENTIVDSQDLIHSREDKFPDQERHPDSEDVKPFLGPIYYSNLSVESYDFLREIISKSGVVLMECQLEDLPLNEAVIVNCFRILPHRLFTHHKPQSRNPKMLIVTIPSQSENYNRFGRVLSLPTCYSALQGACREIVGGAVENAPLTFIKNSLPSLRCGFGSTHVVNE